MCEQILAINKNVNNMKVLAKAVRVPFKTNIETQMIKYLQWFLEILEELQIRTIFTQSITGEICKPDSKSKQKFFQNRAKQIFTCSNIFIAKSIEKMIKTFLPWC